MHNAFKEKLFSNRTLIRLNFRSAENDRAVSLLEAVKNYVGENNFNNLQQNSNVSSSSGGVSAVNGSMIRTVSTFNLTNGLLEENNNREERVMLETLYETANDTDLSQSSENTE